MQVFTSVEAAHIDLMKPRSRGPKRAENRLLAGHDPEYPRSQPAGLPDGQSQGKSCSRIYYTIVICTMVCTKPPMPATDRLTHCRNTVHYPTYQPTGDPYRVRSYRRAAQPTRRREAPRGHRAYLWERHHHAYQHNTLCARSMR